MSGYNLKYHYCLRARTSLLKKLMYFYTGSPVRFDSLYYRKAPSQSAVEDWLEKKININPFTFGNWYQWEITSLKKTSFSPATIEVRYDTFPIFFRTAGQFYGILTMPAKIFCIENPSKNYFEHQKIQLKTSQVQPKWSLKSFSVSGFIVPFLV